MSNDPQDGCCRSYQLAFDWPLAYLDKQTRARIKEAQSWIEEVKRQERDKAERQRRELWRQGKYNEVQPPLCWLCPWVHAPASIPEYTLCPAHIQDGGVWYSPKVCLITEHIYWDGIDTCPWCRQPMYRPVDPRGKGTVIHILPACFGPQLRYICTECFERNPKFGMVQDRAFTLCGSCPVVDDCDRAYE